MSFFQTQKAKKAALLKKNKFHQDLFNFVRLRHVDEERVDALETALKPKRYEKKDDKAWSDKTVSIRNRLNDRKRDSKERWNRFAGTGGEGGRGL